MAGYVSEPSGQLPNATQTKIKIISMTQCYHIYHSYAQTAHKICTRNDYKEKCPVIATGYGLHDELNCFFFQQEDRATMLTCEDKNGGIKLVGTAAFGPNFCGSLNMPGVFTNLAANLDWIVERFYSP